MKKITLVLALLFSTLSHSQIRTVLDQLSEVSIRDFSKVPERGLVTKASDLTKIGELVSNYGRGENFACTAFLTGPNLIMTAAHCVYQKKNNRIVYPKKFFYYLGKTKNSYLDFARAELVQFKFHDSAGADWAVLELDSSLGNRFGWYDTTTLSENIVRANLKNYNHLTNIGYAGDLPKELDGYASKIEGCKIIAGSNLARNYYYTNCYANKGASGSPLLYRTPGGKDLVVGILSQYYTFSRGIKKLLNQDLEYHLFSPISKVPSKYRRKSN